MHRTPLMIALVFPLPAVASVVETSAGPMMITEMAAGMDEPWGLAHLPDGRFLVTERDGRLLLFAMGGTVGQVAGVPDVYAQGQGGLLDVMVARDFATSGVVWLSFSQQQGAGAGTAAAKARLSADGTQLEDVQVVFTSPEGGDGGRHFGSRLVEALDGTVFLTIGDRGTGPEGLEAQDLGRAEGKVIHMNADGTPATTLEGALPGVFSSGHRNAQGAALDAEGRLWVVEHGAQGGDELNLVVEGGNYGWPVIAYGEQYGGGQIGVGVAQDGMEQPALYWDPSIAPSGLMFHSGTGAADWAGDAFVGSLKFDYIAHLDAANGWAEERIAAPQTARVRDVVEGPDGAVWFLSVNDGAVYRMARVE